MKKVCCRCRREKEGDLWVNKAVREDNKISYGFCPSCYQDTLAEIERAYVSRVRSRTALVVV